MAMRVVTDAFVEGGPIPSKHARDNGNRSPELKWAKAPEGTRSFCLVMEDPDAPGGTFTHWLLYDIPADTFELKEGQDLGTAGRNDFQFEGYGGPQTPPRHGKHRYFFKLHALDADTLGLDAGATREQVLQAMEGHVLDRAETFGTFERT